MKKHYEAAGYSEIGNGRRLNEDNIGIVELNEAAFGLFILCDGMGGHKRGDLASELAVRYTRRSVTERLDPEHGVRELRAMIFASLIEVNQRIHNFARRSERFEGMGTTIVVALLRYDGLLIYGHAGDSRLYSTNQSFRALTKDHSVAQAFIDRGLLRPDEVQTFPRRHEITRCIGMGEGMRPSVGAVGLESGDRLLLCSDGLHGVCPDEVIAEVLQRRRKPEPTCHELIRTALDYRSRDNISCIVVDYLKDPS